jgi:hypothetical protein
LGLQETAQRPFQTHKGSLRGGHHDSILYSNYAINAWINPNLAAHIPVWAGNDIMGEIQFVGASKRRRPREFGSMPICRLPQRTEGVKEGCACCRVNTNHGEAGRIPRLYTEGDLGTGQKHVIQVAMQKNPAAQYPEATAQIKMSVSPNRAAVFLDDQFVGHVDEFDGPGQHFSSHLASIASRSRSRVTASFETELNLLAEQKFELKTDLFKGSILQAGP